MFLILEQTVYMAKDHLSNLFSNLPPVVIDKKFIKVFPIFNVHDVYSYIGKTGQDSLCVHFRRMFSFKKISGDTFIMSTKIDNINCPVT